jgi:hypothetical protein
LRRITRKRMFWVALGLVVLAAAGVGVAAWITTVNQPKTAGHLATLTITAVTPTAPASGTCVPGGTCEGNIALTNDGSADLQITGYTGVTTASQWNTPSSSISGATGTCTTADLSNFITVPARSGLSIPVPKGATTTITLPNLYSIGSGLPTGCQGGSFVLAPQSGMVVTVSTQ